MHRHTHHNTAAHCEVNYIDSQKTMWGCESVWQRPTAATWETVASVGSKNCHVPATAAPEQCLNRQAAGTGPRPAGLHRNRLAACWPLWPGTGQPWQAALLHRNRPAPRPKQPILAKTNLGQMLHPQWACKHATPAASANPRAHESKGMQIQGCTNHKLKGVQIQGCVNSRVHELRACESRTQDRACKL